ncbi:hydroxyacylglutathione hydrolase [Aureococcus anophagefferens]|nr:hydroxyacylglutathione hydrolase [Aureococcus anophagefferens]
MAALSSSTCVTVTPVPALSDNYMYLLVDEQTKLAAVVDPVDARAMASAAAAAGATIAMVLTTHGHWDHAGGNAELAASRPASRSGGRGDAVAACTREVWDGDEIALGASTIRVLSTPCHTQGHVCFVVDGNVFTGDTMFVSGCGNFNGGSPRQMLDAFDKLLALPDDTLVWCGHEYTRKNCCFAAYAEPDNDEIRRRLDWAKEAGSLHGGGRGTVPTTIGAERACNPFARVDAPAIAAFCPRAGDDSGRAPRPQGKDDWGRMRWRGVLHPVARSAGRVRSASLTSAWAGEDTLPTLSSFLKRSLKPFKRAWRPDRPRAHHKHTTMFSFPLLTNDEILTCLRELEFSISEEELRDPERHRVAIRVVLEQLMEMCVGVTREDLSTAKVSVGRETICYPELHEDSITELAMFRAVADMMRTCGVADFGLRDWFSPTPKRLRKNLSAVLNFAKYREDMLIVYKQLCEWRDGQLRWRPRRAEADVAARLEVLEGATTGDRREAAAVAADVDAMEAAAADARAAPALQRRCGARRAGRGACQAQGHAADLERARTAGRELKPAATPRRRPTRRGRRRRAGAARLADAKADVAAAADAVLAVERDLEDQKRSLRELRDLGAARRRRRPRWPRASRPPTRTGTTRTRSYGTSSSALEDRARRGSASSRSSGDRVAASR